MVQWPPPPYAGAFRIYLCRSVGFDRNGAQKQKLTNHARYIISAITDCFKQQLRNRSHYDNDKLLKINSSHMSVGPHFYADIFGTFNFASSEYLCGLMEVAFFINLF